MSVFAAFQRRHDLTGVNQAQDGGPKPHMERRKFFRFLGAGAAATAASGVPDLSQVTAQLVGNPGVLGAAAVGGVEPPVIIGMLKSMLAPRADGFKAEQLSPRIFKLSGIYGGDPTENWVHLDGFLPMGNNHMMLLGDPVSRLPYSLSRIPKSIWEPWSGDKILPKDVLEVLKVESPADHLKYRQVTRALRTLSKLATLEPSGPVPPHINALRPRVYNLPYDHRHIMKVAREQANFNRAVAEYTSKGPRGNRDLKQKLEQAYYRLHSDEIQINKYNEMARQRYLHSEIRRRIRWTQVTRDRRRPRHQALFDRMWAMRQLVLDSGLQHLSAPIEAHGPYSNIGYEKCQRVVRRLDEHIEILKAALSTVPMMDGLALLEPRVLGEAMRKLVVGEYTRWVKREDVQKIDAVLHHVVDKLSIEAILEGGS